MREIKFIAFDTYFKELVKVNKIDFSLKNARVLPFDKITPDAVYETSLDNLKLMQHTGLKDKNGIEIYDGYVIKVFPKNFVTNGFTGQCKITPNGTFVFGDVKKGDMSNDLGLLSSFTVEVIGNIYENKELLE